MSSARKVNSAQPYILDLDGTSNPKADPACIGVGTSLPPEEVLRLALDHGMANVVQKDGFDYDREIRSSEVLVESPDTFLTHPIATIFTPDDLSPESERALISLEEHFNCSSQKRAALDNVSKAMQSKGFAQTTTEDVLAVADEMFTNAVYNAPFVDTSNKKNPGINRQDIEIRYEGDKHARLLLAHDESRLMIGCEDPFGSLNLQRYLGKIQATYKKGAAATMNFGPGGAGLGSYIIYNTGASLYFGVWPKRATMLCCVLPLGISYRKRVQLPKNLHWIQR